MHLPTLDADIPAITANISANNARLTAVGVQVQITELDVSLPVNFNRLLGPDDSTRQADVYRDIRACLNSASCTAIRTPGIHWQIPLECLPIRTALPFDRAYPPKAAYAAILEEFSAERSPLMDPG